MATPRESASIVICRNKYNQFVIYGFVYEVSAVIGVAQADGPVVLPVTPSDRALALSYGLKT